MTISVVVGPTHVTSDPEEFMTIISVISVYSDSSNTDVEEL